MCLQIWCHSMWRKLSVFNFLFQPHSIPCQGGWTQVAWFGGKCLYLLSSLASPNVKFLIMKLAVLTLIVIIASIFPEYRCECEASESRGADTVKIYMNWDRQNSIQNQQLHRGNDFLQIFRLFFAALGFLLAWSKRCHSHTMLFRTYCSGPRSGRSTDFCLKLGCFLTYATPLQHTGQSQSQLIYFYIQNYMQLSYHLSSVLKLLSTKSPLQ